MERDRDPQGSLTLTCFRLKLVIQYRIADTGLEGYCRPANEVVEYLIEIGGS